MVIEVCNQVIIMTDHLISIFNRFFIVFHEEVYPAEKTLYSCLVGADGGGKIETFQLSFRKQEILYNLIIDLFSSTATDELVFDRGICFQRHTEVRGSSSRFIGHT